MKAREVGIEAAARRMVCPRGPRIHRVPAPEVSDLEMTFEETTRATGA
jgi:hypothetical protein